MCFADTLYVYEARKIMELSLCDECINHAALKGQQNEMFFCNFSITKGNHY